VLPTALKIDYTATMDNHPLTSAAANTLRLFPTISVVGVFIPSSAAAR